MLRLILALAIFASPALATEGALPIDQALTLAFAESTAACAADGGTLQWPENPATSADLTGDGTADDWIIFEAGAFCGPDLGFLGGSGGNAIHAVVGNSLSSWYGGSWVVQDVVFAPEGEPLPPTRILLIAAHGSACDTYGAAPCVIAATWDGERMISYLSGLEEDSSN